MTRRFTTAVILVMIALWMVPALCDTSHAFEGGEFRSRGGVGIPQGWFQLTKDWVGRKIDYVVEFFREWAACVRLKTYQRVALPSVWEKVRTVVECAHSHECAVRPEHMNTKVPEGLFWIVRLALPMGPPPHPDRYGLVSYAPLTIPIVPLIPLEEVLPCDPTHTLTLTPIGAPIPTPWVVDTEVMMSLILCVFLFAFTGVIVFGILLVVDKALPSRRGVVPDEEVPVTYVHWEEIGVLSEDEEAAKEERTKEELVQQQELIAKEFAKREAVKAEQVKIEEERRRREEIERQAEEARVIENARKAQEEVQRRQQEEEEAEKERIRVEARRILFDLPRDQRNVMVKIQEKECELSMNFREIPVPDDGNCLFYALSVHLFGATEKHKELRKDVCDWMAKNESFEMIPGFPISLSEEMAWGEFVSRMRCDAWYGTVACLYAVSELCNITINILSANSDDMCISPQSPSPAKVFADCWLSFAGKHYTLLKIDPTRKRIVTVPKTIPRDAWECPTCTRWQEAALEECSRCATKKRDEKESQKRMVQAP